MHTQEWRSLRRPPRNAGRSLSIIPAVPPGPHVQPSAPLTAAWRSPVRMCRFVGVGGAPPPQSGTRAPRSSLSYCCVFFANADGFASAHGEHWCVVLPVGVSLSVLMSGDAGLRNRPALSSAAFGKRFGKIGVGPAVSPRTSGLRAAPSAPAPATTPATGSPLTPLPPLGRPLLPQPRSCLPGASWAGPPAPLLLPVLACPRWPSGPRPLSPHAAPWTGALSLRLACPEPRFSDLSSWGPGTRMTKLFRLTTIRRLTAVGTSQGCRLRPVPSPHPGSLSPS